VGLSRRFGASLLLPVRRIRTSIRYLDTSGDEVQLSAPDIHHRDEVVAGIADPMVLGAVSGTAFGWRLTARAGVTLPLGRTEEDPFARGALGLEHQHIQMGTGTVNPVLAAEVARTWGDWRVGGFALTQQVVYENGKGYQAGDRYAGGLAARRRFPRWSVGGSIEVQAETAERWGGVVYMDDGNRGRFDLILGAAASWRATEQVELDLALKWPVVTHAVGGQLDMPVIVQLGAAWSFGGARTPVKATADDHGHDDHDHGDDHGHDDHDHDDHGHDDHDAVGLDTAGLDIADVSTAEAAGELVPVAGKLTIFDFWATWCAPCKVLEPELIALARAHPELVAIRRIDAVDWDSAAVARHLTPGGFNLPHVKIYDPSGRLLLERGTEPGGLDALIEAIRGLVRAAAARRDDTGRR